MRIHPLKTLRINRSLIIQIALALLWILVLSWGEHSAFYNSVHSCQWEEWEEWPAEAIPHRVVLVADPQLVDPHTYPGRPWPLSSFTVWHTDQYLRRAFTFIQTDLKPQSVLFLGDLFDGGREWSTLTSKSPEERWHKYDDRFWLREYERFGNIFLGPWSERLRKERSLANHKFLASLPGNHDLGFSDGIQLPVRRRFNTFFGESNRVDIIGNHSFVSVDTVSLSARSHHQNDAIWTPAENFLEGSEVQKAHAVKRELSRMFRPTKNGILKHNVVDLDKFASSTERPISFPAVVDMPTILLTHVPLFRPPATPCGPLRERWPPSVKKDATPPEKDERNAIKIHGGYQYQNVLDEEISRELIDKIDGIEQVFSGDDHDYCEVIHHRYGSREGGIREITVKSLSWAMGVDIPGFQLLSLWNPVDANGSSLHSRSIGSTMQTRLCLLPYQLGIFIRYLSLLVVTVVTLFLEAVITFRHSSGKLEHERTLLPTSNIKSSKLTQNRDRTFSASIATSSNSEGPNQLASRSAAYKSRSSSPSKSYGYEIPIEKHYHKGSDHGRELYSNGKHNRTSSYTALRTNNQTFMRRFLITFSRVASVGLFYYAWLALTS